MYPLMVKHFIRNFALINVMIMHGADLRVVNEFHSFKLAKRLNLGVQPIKVFNWLNLVET
jgi:hypothetical protein